MTKTSTPPLVAGGSPVDRVVGRLVPERAESSVDYWQQRGYLGSPEEWREACRLFRVRCNTNDCEQMAKLRAYIEDGLLIVARPSEVARHEPPNA